MTREDTILTQLMEIRGALGRVEGGQTEIKTGQADMRRDISDLYDLHRACAGPHLGAEVEGLREDFKSHIAQTTRDKSDSKIPRPSGGVLLSWGDLKVVLRSLPFAAAAVAAFLGVNQCASAPQSGTVHRAQTGTQAAKAKP